MPPNNRRGGSRRRVSHLKEAPPPARQTTRSTAEEEAPFATAGNVAITLTPDEYLELIDKGAEQSDAGTSTGLLAVPDGGSRAEVNDEDGPFQSPNQEQQPIRDADDAPGDQQARGAHPGRPAQLDGSTLDEPQQNSPGAGSLAMPTGTCADDDVDPTFEKLAVASATASPRTLGVRGSAAIDSPPIRPSRKRTPRSSQARLRRRSMPRAGRRWVAAAVVVMGSAALSLVLVGMPQRPSHSAAVSSQQGSLFQFATLGRAGQDPFAPKATTLAAASTQNHEPGARPRPRRSLARQRKALTARRQHPRRAQRRQTAVTPQRTESAAARTSHTTTQSSSAESTPATSPSTSSDSSGASGGGSSASPPAYGEGGVLGAGHAG